MLGTLPKGAADILVYTVDWSNWLNAGDSVASSVWTVPSGLVDVADSRTSTTSVVKISGGVAGTSYVVMVTIMTTISGETRTESFGLRVTH